MISKSFGLAIGLALVCVGWARADSIPPTFELTLAEWAPEEFFTATANSTYSKTEEEGFIQNAFCPGGNYPMCICNDPGVRLTVPADPVPFDNSTTFTTDEDGGFQQGYTNVGNNIETMLLTTTVTPSQLEERFTCFSNEFQFCGFKLIDPSGNEELEILFTDPVNPGGIPSATPEPSEIAVTLASFGFVIAARRWRSRRTQA
jgi:hypothetical protein